MVENHNDEGHQPQGGHRREYPIYVNTRPHKVTGHEISFEQVVLLAYPTPPPGENIGYTVTYQRGPGGKDGQLVAGQSVKLREHMIFDVTATDLS